MDWIKCVWTHRLMICLVLASGCSDNNPCPDGTKLCNDVCTELATDVDHCGSCENACGSSEECVDGTCVCVAGTSDCNGVCVNLDTDSKNCGYCGNTCGSGETCNDGNCEDKCENSQINCEGVCIDPTTSNSHCGASDPCDTSPGEACNVINGFTCIIGACNCPIGMTECGAPPECVDTNTDENNCGTCGRTCRPDQYCKGGICACASGLSDCSGACVDTNIAEEHCGVCDNSCRADEVCIDGICGCPSGSIDCYGICTDPQTDSRNCGTCGNDCGSHSCVDGICSSNGCISPKIKCGSDCIDPSTNNEHCGASDPCNINPGESCNVTDDFLCQNGFCQCMSGLTECSSVCVNTDVDNLNCGSCGIVCSGGSVCSDGSCKCGEYLTFCPEDGLCFDLDCDESHCGDCVSSCLPIEECVSGLCLTPTPVDNPEISCEDSGLPLSSNTQCTAMFNPPCEWHQQVPVDVTDVSDWITDDPKGIIESVVDGFVTMSDSGDIGDTATIYSVYEFRQSNGWIIEVLP